MPMDFVNFTVLFPTKVETSSVQTTKARPSLKNALRVKLFALILDTKNVVNEIQDIFGYESACLISSSVFVLLHFTKDIF